MSINATANVTLTDQEIDEVNQFKCDFFGDIAVTFLPVTYEDSALLYSDLPKIINRTSVVPVRVYMLPIYLLNNKYDETVKRISDDRLEQIIDRIDKYEEIRRLVGDLRETDAYHKGSFKNQISGFMRHLNAT